MEKLLDGILYTRDNKRFDQIRGDALGFACQYIGNNIINDGIFSVIENYAGIKEISLEWIRIPVEDPDLCACTFVRGGRIFVLINTSIPISKQIFAAAHELYHIKCYLENDSTDLERRGSILKLDTIDEGTTELEETEANAFAGTLLAPSDYIDQQIKIYRINKDDIRLDDVLMLMDVFAIPYKAVILRLREEEIISEDRAIELLAIRSDEILNRMDITGKGKRWNGIPEGNESLGSVIENLMINEENEALPFSRIEGDKEKLEMIKSRYGIK